MERQAMAEKILVLGVDGLDPRLTSKYVSQGMMPNVEKFIQAGSARKDLVLLGGMPTVTPPMWTTLATGAYPITHGITCFYGQHEELDTMTYNLDSRLCQAEQLWNVFAEAGRKTLVWHWPGSSWPPSSDSPNLHVVDGTSPGSVGMGSCQIDNEYLVVASTKTTEVVYKRNVAEDAKAACVITDLDLQATEERLGCSDRTTAHTIRTMIMERYDGLEYSSGGTPLDVAFSPIKEPSGWLSAPQGAKEFTLLMSQGFVRRPALILANAEGIYDRVALYKNKKSDSPLIVLANDVFTTNIIDDGVDKSGAPIICNRSMRVLEVAPDGSMVRIWVSASMNIAERTAWSPNHLFDDVTNTLGPIPPTSLVCVPDPTLTTKCMLASWEESSHWQSQALHLLIAQEQYEVVFSHFHNVDLEEHTFIRHMKKKYDTKLPEETYFQFMEDVYKQTDRYLGTFAHFLDEGWTIFIISDHGQVCPLNSPPMIGDCMGCNVRVMSELGYTVLKRDENGQELAEIDWNQTRAVATRATHININLKGRNPQGIVEPEDKYELEEQIMTDLYGYRDKTTGKRVIALALRNKDAVILGLGGERSGDIIYFLAEGYNYDHADSLSTTWGYGETSVSPIFIAAGKGIKKGFTTKRIIRQVDVAPTLAVLGGVRMPRECEGAPVYQIFDIC